MPSLQADQASRERHPVTPYLPTSTDGRSNPRRVGRRQAISRRALADMSIVQVGLRSSSSVHRQALMLLFAPGCARNKPLSQGTAPLRHGGVRKQLHGCICASPLRRCSRVMRLEEVRVLFGCRLKDRKRIPGLQSGSCFPSCCFEEDGLLSCRRTTGHKTGGR